MKRTYLIIIAFMVSFFAFSQKKEKGEIIRVEPSGVVVYKPIGMKQTLQVKDEPSLSVNEQQSGYPPVKTIEDYTLEELEQMIVHGNLKIEYLQKIGSDPEDIEQRKANIKLMEERVKQIKQTTGE